MAKIKAVESFSHKVLKAIAISGAVVAAAGNPYFGLKAMGAFKRELKRKKWKEFYRAINSLKYKKRLNVTQKPDGTYTLEITQIGQNTIEKYDLNTMMIKKPKEWDGRWRIMIFDIPKEKQAARTALLDKLKELGFIMIQKSVWSHPYECRSELAVIAKAFEVEPYVYSFVAWDFENDKIYRLKNKFEIKNGIKLE